MKVVLAKDYPKLGFTGDTLNVRGGYGRNYLIPEGIAIEAGSVNARELKHRMGGIVARRRKLKSEAEALASKMSTLELLFTLKIGEGGKAYGSVQSKDILEALAEKGYAVDKSQLRLSDSIRKVGQYSVSLKLHSEVSIAIPVKVQTEKLASQKLASQKLASQKLGNKKLGTQKLVGVTSDSTKDSRKTRQKEATSRKAKEVETE
jgi:large subunit ribosomal protein L9